MIDFLSVLTDEAGQSLDNKAAAAGPSFPGRANTGEGEVNYRGRQSTPIPWLPKNSKRTQIYPGILVLEPPQPKRILGPQSTRPNQPLSHSKWLHGQKSDPNPTESGQKMKSILDLGYEEIREALRISTTWYGLVRPSTATPPPPRGG
jgi:hypothetical protein